MKCSIVKELLSNYIDGLCSREINEEIKEHLLHCSDCQKMYEQMSAPLPGDMAPEDTNIEFLKKLKKRMLRRNVMVAVSTCIIILIGFCIFARNYDIPLPFDANRMSVEQFKAAVITGEDGRIVLEDIDPDILGNIIPYNDSHVIDAVRLSYHGINNIGSWSQGRTINRDGREVRVVYYCYTKSLWNSLFIDSDLLGYSESGSEYGSSIYEDTFDSTVYEPQMKEIYYLQIRNPEKFEALSDEEFDRLREKGDLIWSGVI